MQVLPEGDNRVTSKGNKILISIVVPAYNAESTLHRCLDSVLSQSYDYFEIIIINDGSIDSTADIAKSYVSSDDRVKYMNQFNQGVSAARNKGIKASTGRYVLFLDSDDYLSPETLRNVVDFIGKDNYDVVFFPMNITKRNTTTRLLPSLKDCGSLDSDISQLIDSKQLLSPCGKVYRLKTILDTRSVFDSEYSLGEDMLFNFNFFTLKTKYGAVNSGGYCYDVTSDGSLTKTFDRTIINVYNSLYQASIKFNEAELKNSIVAQKKFHLQYLRNVYYGVGMMGWGEITKEQLDSIRQLTIKKDGVMVYGLESLFYSIPLIFNSQFLLSAFSKARLLLKKLAGR